MIALIHRSSINEMSLSNKTEIKKLHDQGSFQVLARGEGEQNEIWWDSGGAKRYVHALHLIWHILVESGGLFHTNLYRMYFIYCYHLLTICPIKAFINTWIDSHVNKNSQHSMEGQAKAKGWGMNAPPTPWKTVKFQL